MAWLVRIGQQHPGSGGKAVYMFHITVPEFGRWRPEQSLPSTCTMTPRSEGPAMPAASLPRLRDYGGH